MKLDFTGKGKNVYQTSGTQNIYLVDSNKGLDFIQKKLPSYLATVILALEKAIKYELIDIKLIPYDIPGKIEFNKVIKYEPFIKEYGSYLYIIDDIYNGMDSEKPGSKSKFLNYINMKYLAIRGDLIVKNQGIDKHKVICDNADLIIDKVIEELKNEYLESSNNSDEIMFEDLHECLIIIVCNAFIDCKVLENPKA